MRSLILEQADQVGDSWRSHYDRLHLHTSKGFSSLPFLSFPSGTPRYPSRLEFVEYLEGYRQRFELSVRTGEQVTSARRNGDGWEVRTTDSRYATSCLVVATGYTRDPHVPRWPGQGDFRGEILHSSAYRNGEPYRDRDMLVIGFGNSGGEIAIDLWEHGARPSLAVRGPVNVIPRELFGVPILALGIAQSKLPARIADAMNAPLLRFVVGDLTEYGLAKLPRGPVSQIRESARIPLIDVGTIELIKRGKIAVRPGVERFTEDAVVFTDGRRQACDGVVLATGYRPRVDAFLSGAGAAYDEDGTPRSSGRESAVPGLYFCGFHVSATGMLREIGIDLPGGIRTPDPRLRRPLLYPAELLAVWRLISISGRPDLN